MSQQKPVKKRNDNFTESEKRILASEHVKYEKIISGELSASLTNKHKDHAWAQLANAVNAVAPTHRTVASVSTILLYKFNTNLSRQLLVIN
jgi:hypothetical protein